jgi:hypothetical protein
MILRPLVLVATASMVLSLEAVAQVSQIPDYWVVSGLREGASLNVRASASTKAEIVIRLSEGAVLKNLGCQASSGWCRVQSADGITVDGWVAARYLTAGAPPPPEDALVPGTRYSATGEIRCTLANYPQVRSCKFGVIRSPNARSTVYISLPDDIERLIEFRDGIPVSPAGVRMATRKVDDTTIVDLDAGAEIFEIVEAIYLGG